MEILMEAAKSNFPIANYRNPRSGAQYFGEMGAPGDAFYGETLHTISINTRETDFGSVIQPIPITLRAYKQFQTPAGVTNGAPFLQTEGLPSTAKDVDMANDDIEKDTSENDKVPSEEASKPTRIARPPKKKWIKEYLEEEPTPVSLRVTELSVAGGNGLVRPKSPAAVVAPVTGVPAPLAVAPAPRVPLVEPSPAPVVTSVVHTTSLLDFVQEHSKQRVNSSHGSQIPSPTSSSSNGTPRAGTREVHNKLEKNRRAHLKECFELLKRQLPATPDDKKTSNLAILGSAIRYIQVLRRKERECEHELERLAREKIAAQQRLATLKREVPLQPPRHRVVETVVEDGERSSKINGTVLGTNLNMRTSPPLCASVAKSSPTLNLSTSLRTVPLQISSAPSQVVRTSYGARHNTLTLTTLSSVDAAQNSQENGVTNTLGTLVHPAQIHLPISQVVGNGGLVVGPAALQLLSTSGLRVLQAPTVHANGLTTESTVVVKENGIVSTPTAVTSGVVVSGLSPIVVSQPAAHLQLQTHTLAHKVVETQMVKGSVAPLTVSARYLSATTIVKPVVVVSSAPTAPTAPAPPSST
ncbi:max-binding protein MNT-like isoform X2 [Aricia agestis]|uniref:max-binding protein MNT-like isoform X2 n=1 Tax=Aricia agestis TaxID=91739 RepID=UPI001C202E9E|nr:max-binding protein MNT-like isoform X2 [Aricia agestis]